jgi:hypothetical protein
MRGFGGSIRWCSGDEVKRDSGQGQPQIPFGDDNQKGNGNGKGKGNGGGKAKTIFQSTGWEANGLPGGVLFDTLGWYAHEIPSSEDRRCK